MLAILPELLANDFQFVKPGSALVGNGAEDMELQLADLADDWLEKMREAALLADFDLIDKLLVEIVSLGTARVSGLHDMARRYDTAGILQFLNRNGN